MQLRPLLIASRGAICPAISMLPEYLAKSGYQNPGDAFDGPWQYARRTDKHYFDWIAEKPTIQQAFNITMTISRLSKGKDWFEFYPLEKLQTSESRPLLVDIGGGLGHDLIAFQQKTNLKGRLILEDLPAVVAEAKDLPEGIEAVGHDFFKPQPPAVKNAKAYYMRTILHDWPDKQARQILAGIRKVMASDSILLVNENVLPGSNVPLIQAQMDLAMMACFSSLDRTEQQFGELFDSAGFKITQTWYPDVAVGAFGTFFEVVLKS